MVVKLLKEVVKRMNMDPALVEDICLGNVRSMLWPSKPHIGSPQSTSTR